MNEKIEEFETGVEDTRSIETLLNLINMKLDIFEISASTTYVLHKFAEEGSGKYDSEEGEYQAMMDEGEKSTLDITLNLDNDYFRVLKIEQSLDNYKYSVIAQIDFDNITFDEEVTGENSQKYEDLISRLRNFGDEKYKRKAEEKYLVGGGKNQQAPEFDKSMLKK